MLPMVSSVKEVDDSMRYIEQAYQEVLEEGIEIKRPPIGVMIEVPAAVYQIKLLARRVDFLSVGSNDLIQYLLAVDRNNSRVAQLYDELHPAVLTALQEVVHRAHEEGKPVSLCGEMASEPAAVILLLAMGFDMLSMSSVLLPRVKWIIRNITMDKAKALLKQALAENNPTKIRFYLEQALEEHGLGGLIRAGK
jgi:phosphotransferase system enzyme I (PtsP)